MNRPIAGILLSLGPLALTLTCPALAGNFRVNLTRYPVEEYHCQIRETKLLFNIEIENLRDMQDQLSELNQAAARAILELRKPCSQDDRTTRGLLLYKGVAVGEYESGPQAPDSMSYKTWVPHRALVDFVRAQTAQPSCVGVAKSDLELLPDSVTHPLAGRGYKSSRLLYEDDRTRLYAVTEPRTSLESLVGERKVAIDEPVQHFSTNVPLVQDIGCLPLDVSEVEYFKEHLLPAIRKSSTYFSNSDEVVIKYHVAGFYLPRRDVSNIEPPLASAMFVHTADWEASASGIHCPSADRWVLKETFPDLAQYRSNALPGNTALDGYVRSYPDQIVTFLQGAPASLDRLVQNQAEARESKQRDAARE